MYNSNSYIPDFVEIQREGFFQLLEHGIIEELENEIQLPVLKNK